MEIRVEPKAIYSELSLALSIVESKATIPILSNILLRAVDNSLQIAATDLEVTLRTSCPAEVLSPGAVTVHAKKFGPMIHAFLGVQGQLSLKTTSDNKLFIQPVGGREEYHLQTLPEEDYPTLLEATSSQEIRLDAPKLRRALAETLVSVGVEDNRYSVRGGLMILEPEAVTLVSTDSHRLTKSAFPAKTGVPEVLRMLIPRKTLIEMMKLEGDGDFVIKVRDNHIFVDVGHRHLYSRLMDTTFPAYERVIPQDMTISATVSGGEVLGKLRRVAMVVEEKTRAITMSFEPTGTCLVAARNPETGDEGKEYLSCDKYEGEGVTLGFNVDYMLDYFSVVGGEKVIFRMKDSATQAIFQPDRKEEEGGHIYVVMPLRLD